MVRLCPKTVTREKVEAAIELAATRPRRAVDDSAAIIDMTGEAVGWLQLTTRPPQGWHSSKILDLG